MTLITKYVINIISSIVFLWFTWWCLFIADIEKYPSPKLFFWWAAITFVLFWFNYAVHSETN